MDNRATNLAEIFAKNTVDIYYETGVTPMITNDEYEGEIRGKASRLNVLTLSESGGLQNYDGSDLTAGDVKESEATLVTDQQKAYYFNVKSIDNFKSYVDNPESSVMMQKAGELQEAIDSYVLGLYTDVASGNRVGTDYTTGTVAVSAAGVVTGTGTTFTSSMVGLGFKAAGQTAWYRIKTYTSATSITIELDKDDVSDTTYDGGAISAGASYTIEADTPLALTKTNVYDAVLQLEEKLNASKIPAKGRFLVVNSALKRILMQADVIVRDVESATKDIKNGYLGQLSGFDIYYNEQVSGNNTDGYWALAGHKMAITFATAFVETGIEDILKNFGKAYKGLTVYGAKVPDERRKALSTLHFTV